MRTSRDAVIHFKTAKKKKICSIYDTSLVYFMIEHAQTEKNILEQLNVAGQMEMFLENLVRKLILTIFHC